MAEEYPSLVHSLSKTTSRRIFRSNFFTLEYTGENTQSVLQLCNFLVSETSHSVFQKKPFIWVRILNDETSLRALLHARERQTIRSLKYDIFTSFYSWDLQISYLRNKAELRCHDWYLEDGGYVSGRAIKYQSSFPAENDSFFYFQQVKDIIDQYGLEEATVKIYEEYIRLLPYYYQVAEMYLSVSNYRYIYEQKQIARTWLEKNCYPWQKELLHVLKQEPDERKVLYIYDTQGNTGKTTFKDKYFFAHSEDTTCIMSFKTADMLHVVSKCTTCRVVFVDIQRAFLNEYINGNGQPINWGAIENIKNGTFMTPKYNSKIIARPKPHVVIFSNILPIINVWSLDRWILGQINAEDFTIEWKAIPVSKLNRKCDISDFEKIDLINNTETTNFGFQSDDVSREISILPST